MEEKKKREAGVEDIAIHSKVALNIFPEYEIPDAAQISGEVRTIAERFYIPEAGLTLIDFFFTREDKDFILSRTLEEFPAEDMSETYREDAFHRGVISKTDDSAKTYRLNDFYGLLDLFCVSETEKYHTLPREKRKELDAWYFREYMNGLTQNMQERPTSDKVLSLEEMLDFIDRDERQAYLNYCDCKCLGGDCGLPTHTCINLEPGTNGFVKRGISQTLTKDQVKEIIRQSDAAGLVHTLSDHGICNCCDDCCYLFRGQIDRGSIGFWPESPHIISMDTDKCICCGRCVSRCHFGVFTKEGTGKDVVITCDRTTCIGCGLCANTCPSGALTLADRREDQMQIAGVYGEGMKEAPVRTVKR